MSISKTNLLPALFSSLILSSVPVFADEQPLADPEGNPPELAITVGLPIVDLPESAALLEGEGMPTALPIGPAGGMQCQERRVDLSDEQIEKIHSLKNQYLDAVGPKMLEIASKQRKLRDVLLAPSVDAAQAKTLQEAINSLKGEISNLKLENKIDCLSILTPEQRKNIRDRAFRWHGRGPGHEHFHRMHMGEQG